MAVTVDGVAGRPFGIEVQRLPFAHFDLTCRAVDGELCPNYRSGCRSTRPGRSPRRPWPGPDRQPDRRALCVLRHAPLRGVGHIPHPRHPGKQAACCCTAPVAPQSTTPFRHSCRHPARRRSSPWRAGSSLRRPRPGCIRWRPGSGSGQVVAICDYLYYVGPPGPAVPGPLPLPCGGCQPSGRFAPWRSGVCSAAPPSGSVSVAVSALATCGCRVDRLYRPRFFQVEDGDGSRVWALGVLCSRSPEAGYRRKPTQLPS